jgi:subtilisin family serine protease
MNDQKLFSINPATKEPEGINSYPEYRALWHLHATGVLDSADSHASRAWDDADDAENPVTVALIDTSVAFRHPCLIRAIDEVRMVDFSVHAEGAFVVPYKELDSQKEKEERNALNLGPVEGKSTSFPGFSGHGTAMAGLIAGRPTQVPLHVPARVTTSDIVEATTRQVMLPYAGVNPFCKLVPISTSSDPNPDMLLAAFNYADAIDADVIVFATELIPPHMMAAEVAAPELHTAQAQDQNVFDGLNEGRQKLEERLLEIGQTRFIVCAAGNSGANRSVFPASLSAPENKIISVGAVASDGSKTPYSACARVYGPSGDETRLDRKEFRIDPYVEVPEGRPAAVEDQEVTEASIFELVSTDVPGPYGYNPSQFQHTPEKDADALHLDVASLFCRFSGTSGASAVVGGLIALAIQKYGTRDIVVPTVTDPEMLMLAQLQPPP